MRREGEMLALPAIQARAEVVAQVNLAALSAEPNHARTLGLIRNRKAPDTARPAVHARTRAARICRPWLCRWLSSDLAVLSAEPTHARALPSLCPEHSTNHHLHT